MAERIASPYDPATKPSELEAGNVWLNFLTYQVVVGGEPVTLTFQEFELLNALVQRLDRVVPVDALTLAIWGETGHLMTRRLNVLIHRLRHKLADSEPYQIEGVRGRGYGFIARMPRGRTS